MRNVVVEDAAAAVEGIKDGDTVMMGGFGGAGLPLGVVKAVLDRGVRDLTLISNNAGSTDGRSVAVVRSQDRSQDRLLLSAQR
ncbi:acyl CoA:acetate/3-ketoacid CoA transferase alpha subunit [Bradyrhizobium sp. LM2.7]